MSSPLSATPRPADPNEFTPAELEAIVPPTPFVYRVRSGRKDIFTTEAVYQGNITPNQLDADVSALTGVPKDLTSTVKLASRRWATGVDRGPVLS